MRNEYLGEYLNRITSVSQQVRSEFGTLTVRQLNWKPDPQRWSIAQCLHHLIVLNKSYFPTLRKLEADTFENGFWERFSPFSGFFGNLLKKTMTSPRKVKKMKAPAVWQPAQSDFSLTIIDDFINNQKELLDLLNGISDCNHFKTRISSPASAFVTYRLQDAVIVIATHEERHLSQAMEIKGIPGFPTT